MKNLFLLSTMLLVLSSCQPEPIDEVAKIKNQQLEQQQQEVEPETDKCTCTRVKEISDLTGNLIEKETFETLENVDCVEKNPQITQNEDRIISEYWDCVK